MFYFFFLIQGFKNTSKRGKIVILSTVPGQLDIKNSYFLLSWYGKNRGTPKTLLGYLEYF